MKSSWLWLTAATVAVLAGPLVAQVVTPDDEPQLAAAKARSQERVAAVQDGDIDYVLPVNYFLKEYNVPRKVPAIPGQPAGYLTLGDGTQIVAADIVATAMLDVAQPDLATSAQYLQAWIDQAPQLKKQLEGNANVTPRQIGVWMQFLETWQKDAGAAAPDRFREALRQAAYSILRLSLNLEESQVKRVMTDMVNARAGGGGGGAMTTGTAAGGSLYSDPMHARMMNGIYRRHDRRMYRTERITARR